MPAGNTQTQEERDREILLAEVDRVAVGTSCLRRDDDGTLTRVPPGEIPAEVWRRGSRYWTISLRLREKDHERR